MTLITWQNGGPVMRAGTIGAGQECCCNQGCPPGCPSLAGCNLVVVLDFDGFQQEYINSPASDYYNALTCQLAFEIADIPSESGGDISATATVEYDENCDPVVTNLGVTHSQDCNDPDVSCPAVLVSLVCS